MSSGERRKLTEWHASKRNETFNFREEMLQYCRSDVDILRRGCLEFRNLMIKVTSIEETIAQADGTVKKSTALGIDPFDYITIASVCMGIFKSLFLKGEYKIVQLGRRHFKSPIAVVPSQGYTKRDNFSKISIQWLEWLMETSRQRGNPLIISHALNGGEYRVPDTNYRCDGFVVNPTGKGTIYEFYGKS